MSGSRKYKGPFALQRRKYRNPLVRNDLAPNRFDGIQVGEQFTDARGDTWIKIDDSNARSLAPERRECFFAPERFAVRVATPAPAQIKEE